MTIKKGADEKAITDLLQKLSSLPTSEGIDAFKFCGIIKLDEDPLTIQTRMRNEWD